MRPTCDNHKMARLGRSAGVWGAAIALWKLWKRIPAKQRKQLLKHARKHGPRLAKQAYKARRTLRR